MQGLLNIACFKAVWFGSLLGAGTGRPWLGLMLLSAFMAWHFATSRSRLADICLLLLAGLVGLVLDSLFLRAGLLEYAAPIPWAGLAPFWIVVMWMNFALTLNASLRWVQARPALAVVLGAAGGPLAYWAGVSMGAAAWGTEPFIALVCIAFAWAVAVPALAGAARRLAPLNDARALSVT